MQKKWIASIAAFAVAGLTAGNAQAQNCDGGQPVPTSVVADITTNTTWSGHILLEQPVFVRNGATLKIVSGTVVRGQPRSQAVQAGQTAGTPGTLIVTQNGRVEATGDEFNPIIMTTAAVDNDGDGVADDDDNNGFDDPWQPGDAFLDDACDSMPLPPLNGDGDSNVALWGGLVVLGNAPTNLAGKALGSADYGKATVEGLTVPGFPVAQATYGGLLPNDNSGILRYVSVRHAGDEIGNGNELNGITLAGVGAATEISHVEVYANFDDGIEWFGGTVNGDHLAVFYVGDDHFDLDQGYTGFNQFLFAVMPFFNELDGGNYGSRSGDKAGEFDGDDYRPDNVALNGNTNGRVDVDLFEIDPGRGSVGAEEPTPWPLSHPAMWNVTVIGSDLDASPDFDPNGQCTGVGTPYVCCSGAGAGTCTNSTNRGLQFRNGYAGDVFNSIVVNTGAETGIEVDTGIGDGATGWDSLPNANDGILRVVCTTLDDGAALGAAETTVIAAGDALNLALGGTASGANAVNPLNFGLVNEDASFDPQGSGAPGKLKPALKTQKITPTPALSFPPPPIANCPAPGYLLDSAATYRGAFPTGAALWTDNWTTLWFGGLL